MKRAPGHTALCGDRKRKETFVNGGRGEPSPDKAPKSTTLSLDGSSGRENNRQAPKP